MKWCFVLFFLICQRNYNSCCQPIMPGSFRSACPYSSTPKKNQTMPTQHCKCRQKQVLLYPFCFIAKLFQLQWLISASCIQPYSEQANSSQFSSKSDYKLPFLKKKVILHHYWSVSKLTSHSGSLVQSIFTHTHQQADSSQIKVKVSIDTLA